MILLAINGIEILNVVVAVVVASMIAVVIPKTRTVLLPRKITAPPPLIVAWEDLNIKQRKELLLRIEATTNNATISNKILSKLLEDYEELGITVNDVHSFHPVIVFPQVVKVTGKTKESYPYYQVLNLTVASSKDNIAAQILADDIHHLSSLDAYAVGKYNEIRRNLYDEDMFQNFDHQIQGFSGSRIIHMGIDLGGPVGTPVYAFSDGTVLHAGYNPSKGDYGNVLVVQHHWIGGQKKRHVLWALYGHLSNSSLQQSLVGSTIQRGQILGWIGNIHENGGWLHPHLHFQLSITPPVTHDLPGVVSLADRDKALREYPDPRIILGMLYD